MVWKDFVQMIRRIFTELREHAPFTFAGATLGILLVFVLKQIPNNVTFKLFYVFHPLHVLLSAFVTTSMYKLHKKDVNWFKLLLVGLIGSIGVATLSDSVLPYIGETILHFPHRELHLGFVERWYIVDPIAILGIVLATRKPSTKFPHSGHILVSTTASLLHIVMSLDGVLLTIPIYCAMLFLLFLSVWLPCCFSDIVFPLLFVKGAEGGCTCGCGCSHSHSHSDEA